MWNKTPVSQSARTHGLGWRTAHASSIDEKGLIYISLRQLPPRLVRVLLVLYMYIYTLHAWNRWKKCTVSTKTTDSWLVDVNCIHCGQPQIWWLLVGNVGSIWFIQYGSITSIANVCFWRWVMCLLVWFGLVWFRLVCLCLVCFFVCFFFVLRCNSMPTACHCALQCTDREPATVLIVLWLKLGQDRLKATELNGGTERLDWLDCRHWVTELVTLCCIYVKLPLQFCSCSFVRSFVRLFVRFFVCWSGVGGGVYLVVSVCFFLCLFVFFSVDRSIFA